MTSSNAAGLRIGAFNVQVFGTRKAGNDDVMKTLAKIVRRYDIVLIQEVRDKSRTALASLLREVNSRNPDYNVVTSARLGRTASKEQYAFLYKYKSGISVVGTHQYPDKRDAFEREPFAVKFHVPRSEINDFVLIGIHIDPDTAVKEINELKRAHDVVKKYWDMDDILIMGDFNADGRYVTNKELEDLHLRDSEYHWLIEDTADTTVGATDCAYDRLVMTGRKFVKTVKEGSVKVFRFDTAYGLSNEQAADVSDHYPVELQLNCLDTDSPKYRARLMHVDRKLRKRRKKTAPGGNPPKKPKVDRKVPKKTRKRRNRRRTSPK